MTTILLLVSPLSERAYSQQLTCAVAFGAQPNVITEKKRRTNNH